MRIETWTAANETLLIVAASGFANEPVDAGQRPVRPTHTSAGITAAGWRAPAPFLGVTTNEPFLRSTV